MHESLASFFSSSYQIARGKFLNAAAAAGLQVDSYRHPLTGKDGEELAVDVVEDGPQHPSCVLVVSSGCHGVEGYCGSGIQVSALRNTNWRARTWSKNTLHSRVESFRVFALAKGYA